MYDKKYPHMKIISTKRCILRPAKLEDASDLFEYFKQENVLKFLPFNKHKNLKDTKRFINHFFINNYKKGKVGHFVVVSKKNKKVIGNVGFNNISQNAYEGEIGICINPDYWGNDLSTELAEALLRYGFDDIKLSKIFAILYTENIYSKKALEILGFNFTHTFYKNTKSNATKVMCYRYEITRADYYS